jgi:hypothetical protein
MSLHHKNKKLKLKFPNIELLFLKLLCKKKRKKIPYMKQSLTVFLVNLSQALSQKNRTAFYKIRKMKKRTTVKSNLNLYSNTSSTKLISIKTGSLRTTEKEEVEAELLPVIYTLAILSYKNVLLKMKKVSTPIEEVLTTLTEVSTTKRSNRLLRFYSKNTGKMFCLKYSLVMEVKTVLITVYLSLKHSRTLLADSDHLTLTSTWLKAANLEL